MTTDVRDRLNELAGIRGETLARIAARSQAQLDFSPRPGRWSIGEIADHLRLSELLWRREIAQLVALARSGQPARLSHSFAEINVSPLHIPDRILTMLDVPFGIVNRFVPAAVAAMMVELPILPMRNPDSATPQPRRPRADLIADLRVAFEETRRLIDENADLDFEQMVSSHPLMGSNTVPQIFGFLSRHERRHQRQMVRAESEPRFPPG